MKKTLGIIGGMGAAASLRLAKQVVRDSQTKHADDESQYTPFVLFSLSPVAMNEHGFSDYEEMRDQLLDAVCRINKFGCDQIVIACNTAHLYIEQLRTASKTPIVSLVETACETLNGAQKVAVLCSGTANHVRIYDDALSDKSIERVHLTLEEQELVTRAIRGAIAGRSPAITWRNTIVSVVQNLRDRGAEKVIVGCTELPLCLGSEFPPNTIDAGAETIRKALSLL